MATIAAPPQWLQDWLKVEQDRADRRYADNLLSYETQRTKWVEHNIHARELATDPNNYTPTAPPPIPRRTIWKISENNVTLEESLAPADPKISDPVLPPRIQPPPPAPFRTDAPATTDALLAMLRGCLQMLGELRADLAGIKTKLGI